MNVEGRPGILSVLIQHVESFFGEKQPRSRTIDFAENTQNPIAIQTIYIVDMVVT
jgi:hypothetical protein